MLTETLGPVIVGVTSPASLAAVDLAAEEAAARVAPLLILHARHAPAQAPGPTDAELVAVAVARAQSEHPGLAASAESVAGSPSQVLLARAPTSCLVVIGDGGYHGVGETGTASIAVRVARRGGVPVIVHRPLARSGAETPRPVLVGVSADVDLDAVVGFAFGEAWLRGAPVHAMYVRPEHTARADAGADRLLSETVTFWSEKYPDLAVHRSVRYGVDVAVALAAASRWAQLVVVGLGSGPAVQFRSWVAEALVYRAGCPVGVIGQR